MTREEAIKLLCVERSTIIEVDGNNGAEKMLQAYDMAIDALQAGAEFEWCHDCEEYDQDRHCCHRWTKVIRNTVEELKEHYDGYVEVVRCKDCRFAMVRTKEEMNKPIKPQPILCEWLCIGVENDAYCSHGERREP